MATFFRMCRFLHPGLFVLFDAANNIQHISTMNILYIWDRNYHDNNKPKWYLLLIFFLLFLKFFHKRKKDELIFRIFMKHEFKVPSDEQSFIEGEKIQYF